MKINVGIAQTSNSLDIEKNFQTIKALLSRFENSGADVVLFPECSLSGFSAKMKECTSDLLKPYLENIQQWTNRSGIEVILPTAVAKNGLVYNSGWWFKQDKAHQFYKLGLTDSEKNFFSLPQQPTSKVFEVKGFRFALLICYEMEHEPWTYFQPDDADAILWPGYWGWDLQSRWEAEKNPGEENRIFSNANHWKLPILQSNFAFNDIDGHKGAGPQGLSFIIDADNKLVERGCHKELGGLLITLNKNAKETTIVGCIPLLEQNV